MDQEQERQTNGLPIRAFQLTSNLCTLKSGKQVLAFQRPNIERLKSFDDNIKPLTMFNMIEMKCTGKCFEFPEILKMFLEL